MREERTSSIIGGIAVRWLAVLLLFVASAILSSRILQERMFSAGKPMKESADRGNLLAEISRRPAFSFGFRNFLADMVWLEAVQVAGSQQMAGEDYDRLFRLADTAINFDPRFEMPPLLGGIILGDSSAHAAEASRVLNRGWASHPSDWRYPFYMGYILYFSIGDPIGGGKKVLDAARIPGSPPYLPLLSARMLSEGREPETALELLSGMMRQETNPARRDALEKRVREVIVERDLQVLERAVGEYRHRFGGLPENLGALAAVGIIREVPVEPNRGRYIMMPDGGVRSDRVTGRMKVFRSK